MRTSRRRAFTMIELIVVIVILGILAGIAIVGYGAVTTRAKDTAVTQAAQSFNREIQAIKSFGSGGTAITDNQAIAELATSGDLPANVTVNVRDSAGTARFALVNPTTTGQIHATPLIIEFVKNSRYACLTLATQAVVTQGSACGTAGAVTSM